MNLSTVLSRQVERSKRYFGLDAIFSTRYFGAYLFFSVATCKYVTASENRFCMKYYESDLPFFPYLLLCFL